MLTHPQPPRELCPSSPELKHHGQPVDGNWFNHTEPLPPQAHLAYRLETDEWNGVRRVRFLVEDRQ